MTKKTNRVVEAILEMADNPLRSGLIDKTEHEKITILQHDEWLATRPKPTAAHISRAPEILHRPTQNAPDPGDELPEGYVSIRDTDEYK